MSLQDIELVMSIYPFDPEEAAAEFDLAATIEDPDRQREFNDLFRSDAQIRFLTPPSGGIQVMEPDEFEGPQGLAEGWRVWMQPWETFQITYEDLIDAGDGVVLLLVSASARMRDSGVEIPQEAAALHRVENGQIAAISFYLDQAQARHDAGLV